MTFKQLRVAEDSCTQLNCLSVVVTGGENDKDDLYTISSDLPRITVQHILTISADEPILSHTDPA